MAVYLDHAATTPVRPVAADAWRAALADVGNPSSIHGAGQAARHRLETARVGLAGLIGVDPVEVVLTSGGTESVNAAVKGLFWAAPERRTIVVPDGEHHATIDAVEWLERAGGARVARVPLDADGVIDPAELDRVLAAEGDGVALVTALWANNEVGALQDVTALAEVAARRGVPLHLDAVAALGHVPVDVGRIRRETAPPPGAGLVAVSLSGHKVGAPAGSGALVLARDARIEALLHGGGQQRGVRSGTQDVAAAAGFAAALAEAERDRPDESARLARLRDRLLDGVARLVPDATVNGPSGPGRLAMNAHVSIPGCEGDSLLVLLDLAGVRVSTGSACQAGVAEPSHVLQAMGRDEERSRGALRMTLGWTSSAADVDAFLAALGPAVERARRAGFADRDRSGRVHSSR